MRQLWQPGDLLGGPPHRHLGGPPHRHLAGDVEVHPVMRMPGRRMEWQSPDGTTYARTEVRREVCGPQKPLVPGKKKQNCQGTKGKTGYSWWPVGTWADGAIK